MCGGGLEGRVCVGVVGGWRGVEAEGGGGLVASAMRDEAKLISRNSQKVPAARGK